MDLYVLERAFASTHPDSEHLFASVLKAYEKRMGKEWTAVGRRLEDGKLLLSRSFYSVIQLISGSTDEGSEAQHGGIGIQEEIQTLYQYVTQERSTPALGTDTFTHPMLLRSNEE